MKNVRVIWPVHNLHKEDVQFPGIMSISALLKGDGVPVEVVPAEPALVEGRIRPGETTILAYSTPSSLYAFYRDLNGKMKERRPEVVSLFGGPHPTFFPEMAGDDGVDGICIGEGEYPLLDVARRLREGRPWSDVENWWLRENGEIRKNPVRPLLEDLDALPLPDHDLFRRASPRRSLQGVVITSRGCPHSCTYCFNHLYRKIYRGKGRVLRRRSVANVLEELRRMKADGYAFIRFVDDLFILSPEWIREFAEAYRREIAIPFSCHVRANYVTEEIVRSLKDAGCYRVLMGIEAGNDRVRNEILKRRMSKDVIRRAAATLRAAGIRLSTANILAIPGASFEDDWETLELNMECRPDHASVSLMQPFFRTEIYDFALAEGLIDDAHRRGMESSFGYGLTSPIIFRDEGERRRVENLQKLFPLTVRFPMLAPLTRRLVGLPPNRLFTVVYLLSIYLGVNLRTLPPRLGLRYLVERGAQYLGRRRSRRAGVRA